MAPINAIEPAEFYMVWSRRGHQPRRAHDTYDSAEAEALRLAALYPGKKFIVLQALVKVRVTEELPTPGDQVAT